MSMMWNDDENAACWPMCAPNVRDKNTDRYTQRSEPFSRTALIYVDSDSLSLELHFATLAEVSGTWRSPDLLEMHLQLCTKKLSADE